MQVSLPALKAFESAARLGSFKAAAAELSISPTAVSHHISNLEQRLNVSLFRRETRKVILTAPGRELAVATSQGFQTINAALEDISRKDKQINVATTSSFAALVLLPALQRYYDQYPHSKVNITSGEEINSDYFSLPVRLGALAEQTDGDVLIRERFNLYGHARLTTQLDQTSPVTIYTTRWKNSALPEVPLQAWLNHNDLSHGQFEVRYFDQELFGIQQALLENACVFCSTTLTRDYVKAGLLTESGYPTIDSALCYYIENKDRLITRHNVMFIEWLEELLKQH